ncbi:MAG: hypothetical protein KatS3mg113_1119 [Planctomycetaceae bacterium]|nr:MAG: hypothetical protein KatS3mg113_1119 [Planctomycetaceae bacterium]
MQDENPMTSLGNFHPWIEQWFQRRFGSPTEPQRRGWPVIAAGRHTLLAAPTGSGKTLAAFLAVIDRLLKEALSQGLPDAIRVVYVSPLRALSNDMHRNLQAPLDDIASVAGQSLPLRVGLRTGDSTSVERQRLTRKPPHLLVTTPESLYLLLTSRQGRRALQSVDTLIVDEIHALVRDKRGSHLALTIERLAALSAHPIQRIGLSATVKPLALIADYLVGGTDRESLELSRCSACLSPSQQTAPGDHRCGAPAGTRSGHRNPRRRIRPRVYSRTMGACVLAARGTHPATSQHADLRSNTADGRTSESSTQ